MNLNWLEAIHSAKLIDHIAEELQKRHQTLRRVVVDCPSTNIAAYTTYLRSHMKHKGVEVIAEHKADVNHPIVSAASVLAKVRREEEIAKLKKQYQLDFGSGYPSDPSTQEFIKKYWSKHPELFRKSWSSYQAFVKKKAQSSLGDF